MPFCPNRCFQKKFTPKKFKKTISRNYKARFAQNQRIKKGSIPLPFFYAQKIIFNTN